MREGPPELTFKAVVFAWRWITTCFSPQCTHYIRKCTWHAGPYLAGSEVLTRYLPNVEFIACNDLEAITRDISKPPC